MTDDVMEREATGFGQILDDFEKDRAAERREDPKPGDKVKGRVMTIAGDVVFVDLGAKSEAIIDAAELRQKDGALTVAVGDEIEAMVSRVDDASGALVLRKRMGGGRRAAAEISDELRQAFALGLPIEGTVTGFNKGGAEVKVGSLRCFCPTSQLDLRKVEDPAAFVGQKLAFKVARLEEGQEGKRPNVILSRRRLLEEEAEARAAEARERLAPGTVTRGRVTSLTAYGAFLDLGGVEGLLHVSEISHARLAHPSELVAVGQELEVQILKVEPNKDGKGDRISLSRKALEADPWNDAAERFPMSLEVDGRVRRLETFGAFIEVAPGLEGLMHISEIGAFAGRRIAHPHDALQVGQDLRVRVIRVEADRRRISLGRVGGAEVDPAMSFAQDAPGSGDAAGGRRAGGGEGRRRPGSGEGSERERAPRAARGERRAGAAPGRDRDRDRDRPRGAARERAREDREAMQYLPAPAAGFGAMADFFARAKARRGDS